MQVPVPNGHRYTLQQRIPRVPLSSLREAAAHSQELGKIIGEVYPKDIKCGCEECALHAGPCTNALFGGSAFGWPNECGTCRTMYCNSCAIFCGWCAYTICRVCDFCQECDASCCPLCVPLEVCVVCGVASCPSLLVVCTSCGKGACDHCLSVQPSWNCEGRGTDREGDVGCDQKCCPNCRVAPAPHTRCAYCAKNMCSHCLADPDHGCAT